MPKQHQSKAMKQVLREIERLGFTVNHKKSGSYTIIPPSDVDGPIYNTHGTESALHPMRRDFKRLYDIQLPISGIIRSTGISGRTRWWFYHYPCTYPSYHRL